VETSLDCRASTVAADLAWSGSASTGEVAQHASTSPYAPRSTPNVVVFESVEPATMLAVAADGPRSGMYLNMGFGLVTTESSSGPGEEVDFDEGYAVPVAIGRRYVGVDDAVALDLELEGVWTDQDVDDSGPTQAVVDVTQIGLLLNALADLELSDTFGFYAGGGVGLSFLDIGTTSDGINSFSDEDGPFLAWQLKGGLRWWASDVLSWNVGYRFLNIDDVEIDDGGIGASSFDLETQQHVLEIGLRFQL